MKQSENLNLFRKEHLILAGAIFINTVIHLVADFHAGYHGDELLHIEAGRHLAMGYMDFPPVIACLAFIQNLWGSDSIFVNHLFVYLASALILLFTGLITLRLGGKSIALLMALSCIIFTPGFGVAHNLFLPVVFEQLFWIISLYFVVSYLNSPQNRYLVQTILFLAIGFQVKYSILFLISGLLISLLFFNFSLLKKKVFWLSLPLFFILILPNVYWQLSNDFPVFHHVSVLYDTQLNRLSLLKELQSLVMFLNPLTMIVWASALLITPFLISYKKYKLYNYTLVFAFVLLLLSRGKSYYYFPVVLGLLPLGATFLERVLERKTWILKSYLVVIILTGALLMPKALTVISLENYISLYHLKKDKDNRIPVSFESYYSRGIWNQLLESVERVYNSLPASAQANCLIWGRHYSQAERMNLLGKRYGLPAAFSFHSSCYCWVPEFSKANIVIVIADPEWDKEHWLRYFDEVEEKAVIENPFTSDKKWYFQRIFLCRGLKYSSKELKQLFKNEIF